MLQDVSDRAAAGIASNRAAVPMKVTRLRFVLTSVMGVLPRGQSRRDARRAFLVLRSRTRESCRLDAAGSIVGESATRVGVNICEKIGEARREGRGDRGRAPRSVEDNTSSVAAARALIGAWPSH